MTKDTPPLSEEEIRAIAERRAEALKRVQALHHQKPHADIAAKPAKGPKMAPSKNRNFRHQGR